MNASNKVEDQAQALGPAPLIAGLTIVYGPLTILGHVRDLLEREYSSGRHRSKNRRTRASKVLALYGGGGGLMAKAKEYARGIGPGHSLKNRRFDPVGETRQYEFASVEGLSTLAAKAKNSAGSLITFEAQSIAEASIQMVLLRIAQIGREEQVNFMAFIRESTEMPVEAMKNCCDEFIQVCSCDADPDADLAFAIINAEAELLSLGGANKVMCQIRDGKDGLKARTFQPHVADKLKDRTVVELCEHGFNQKQVAVMFGESPSTTSRQITKMPYVRRGSKPMTDERLAMLVEHFGLTLPVDEKPNPEDNETATAKKSEAGDDDGSSVDELIEDFRGDAADRLDESIKTSGAIDRPVRNPHGRVPAKKSIRRVRKTTR